MPTPTIVPMLTLADARIAIGNLQVSALSDVDLQLYIDAAVALIEDQAGPCQFAQKTYIRDGGTNQITLPERPNMAYDFTVLENGVNVTDFTVDAYAAILYAGRYSWQRQWYPGWQNIQITMWQGRDVVPRNLTLALRELLRFMWQIGKQGTRPGRVDADMSATVPMGFILPNRVLQLCSATPNLAGFA